MYKQFIKYTKLQVIGKYLIIIVLNKHVLDISTNLTDSQVNMLILAYLIGY